MKQRMTIGLLLLLGLCFILPVHAQDVSTTPEPGSRADNECYTDGTMEGKCGGRGFHADGSYTKAEVSWAWRCGWYMSRFNDGKISRNKVPSDCGILLPGPSDESGVNASGGCIVTFGGYVTECLSGGVLSQDSGNDGTFEYHFYVVSSNVSGDGGACPAGTVYSSDIGLYSGTADFYAFLINNGYRSTDDFCRVL